MLLCALYVLVLVAAVANGQCVPPRVREANELEFQNNAEKFYFSTFGWLCQRVNRVCLDSGAVIIHDPELQRKHPESVFGGGLPNFGVEDIAEGFRHVDLGGQQLPVWGSAPAHTLPVRWATPQEHQSARFSNCTVPVIFHQHFMVSNMGEFMARTLNHMHWWTHPDARPGPVLSENMTVVLATSSNQELNRYHREMLQPFTRLGVSSLATFSSRRPPSARSRATMEGRHVRCFERTHFCRLEHAMLEGMFDMASRMLSHFLPKAPAFDAAAFWGEAAGGSGEVRAGGWAPGAPSRKLRVLIEERGGMQGTRRILNLAQLVEECNTQIWPEFSAAHRPAMGEVTPNNTDDAAAAAARGGAEAPSSPFAGVVCRVHQFGRGSLASDMALMQTVDVFITLHGAGEMNSLYMRPDSSLIELRGYELGTKYDWLPSVWWPVLCPLQGWQLRCWFVNLDEERGWEAGPFERARVEHESATNPHFAARDRSTVFTLQQLEFSLARVVALEVRSGGGADAGRTLFEREWGERRVSWTFANGSVWAADHVKP